MSLFKFLKSRVFFNQLLIAAVLIIVILLATMRVLKVYTMHGDCFPTPDFTGMTPAQIKQSAIQNNLRYVIADSLYMPEAAPGVAVDQIPVPGHKVKKNRTIFVTINSTQPEMVILPKLTDISFRQARAIIENSGLKTGKISHIPSEYNNLVLKIELEGKDIKPGTKIQKGSRIDLIIGRIGSNQTTLLPDLTGFTIHEADSLLTEIMLNIGVVLFDETVLSEDDSIRARIWRQRPDAAQNNEIMAGASIDLWATVDSVKYAPPTVPEVP